MNSKDRVLMAINLQKTDRIPKNFHGMPSVVEKLFQYYSVNSHVELMKHLQTDIIDIRGIIDPIWNGLVPKVIDLENGVKQNYLGWQMKTIKTQYGLIEEHCGFIFENVKEIEEIEKFNWPKVEWFDFSNMIISLNEFKRVCHNGIRSKCISASDISERYR